MFNFLKFTLLHLLVFYVNAQDNKYLPVTSWSLEIVKHENFILGYSEEYEQAMWVAYELTSEELISKYERKDNFREDPYISTGSASLADYKGSGYDRGHLAPAADMAFSASAMSESFYMSNMSPQEPSFNRGIWKKLEEQVRQWTLDKGKLYIVTGGIISDSDPEIGPNGVEIPGYFYKVLFDEKNNQMIGFVLENANSSNSLLSYAVTIDQVENLTGLDFFSQLDNAIEQQIESIILESEWSISGRKPRIQQQVGERTSQQCLGIANSTGGRCKNLTKNENGYCSRHQIQVETDKAQNSSKQCVAITNAGTQCKRKATSAGSYCWQHN